jgi:cell division protein FtsB
MKEKIKKFFAFARSAWTEGPRGKIGLCLMILSVFFFVRLFYGEKNLQSFIVNAWHLNRERKELSIAQKELDTIQHHIYLLQHPNSSSDYIEELGLKTLNLGDADFQELKY